MIAVLIVNLYLSFQVHLLILSADLKKSYCYFRFEVCSMIMLCIQKVNSHNYCTRIQLLKKTLPKIL